MPRSFYTLLIFAIAMAFLESAVVIYIREIYYPAGFQFPLQEMKPALALTELLREAATMVMLISLAILASKKRTRVFACFLLAFAVWDIFYYVFLKLLIGWPASFQTWDILFLIPVMWAGPVWAPLGNSIMMIAIGISIMIYSQKKSSSNLIWKEWLLLVTGALLVIISYTEEYMRFMLQHFTVGEMIDPLRREEVFARSVEFIPENFIWSLYLAGCVLHVTALIHYLTRMKKTSALEPCK
jgi:hypothetical protein